jgi:ADP-ribose pyrophosphatase
VTSSSDNPSPASDPSSDVGVPWQVIQEEVCFEASPWIKVSRQKLRLPDGKVLSDYYQVANRSYVEILPIRANGDLLGLWRYKHGPRQACWGFPAGYIERGEEPLAAAKRELQEECGLASDQWTFLGSHFLDGNRSSDQVFLFLAENVQQTETIPSDDLEATSIHWAPQDVWRQRLLNGEIATVGVAMAIARLSLRNPT